MDKNTFRSHALRQLRAASGSRARYGDRRIARRVLARIDQHHARSVLLYLPMKIEVNLLPLIHTLRRRNIIVWVPFMQGESFRLVQYRLPLQITQYGVREPKFSRKYRKKRIDIAIVPIIGTDPTLRRIGFGKGMYDRFFAREGAQIAYTVFVQRIAQVSPDIVTDRWDVQADELIAGCG